MLNIKHYNSALMKLVAVLLITNSHLSLMHINPLIATGGSIGNSLFFFISGYGLTKSSTINLNFNNYIVHRFRRVIPAFLICSSIYLIFLRKATESIFEIMIFPSKYWFIPALILFYILFFFYIKLNERFNQFTPILLVVLGIAYLYMYFFTIDISTWSVELFPIRWIYSFGIFIWGSQVSRLNKDYSTKSLSTAAILFGLMGILYGIVKVIIYMTDYYEYQLVVMIINLSIVWFLYVLSSNTALHQIIQKNKVVVTVIAILSNTTLEIYLVQYFFFGNPAIVSLPYGINILTFGIIVIICAVLLQYLVNTCFVYPLRYFGK